MRNRRNRDKATHEAYTDSYFCGVSSTSVVWEGEANGLGRKVNLVYLQLPNLESQSRTMCHPSVRHFTPTKLPRAPPIYSRCMTTIRPINPSMTVFIQGCSESMMVTYPTRGMYAPTRPIMSVRAK